MALVLSTLGKNANVTFYFAMWTKFEQTHRHEYVFYTNASWLR